MMTVLTIIAITGCGLMAGLFFVFSVSVMAALAQMPGGEGMRAMQLINRTILNPVFLGAFIVTAVCCLAISVLALSQRPDGFAWALGGAATYLIGGFGVTAAGNVPLNNRLDAQSCDSPEGLELWAHYLKVWTRLNHIRTVACTVAVVMLSIALSV